MKSLKNQKGITLVALVITIIVLLILAGISLSLVLGDNGILGRASNSSAAQKAAAAKDLVELDVAELAADFYQAKYVNNSLPSGITTIGGYIQSEREEAHLLADGSTYSVAAKSGDTYAVTLTVKGAQGNGVDATCTGAITEDGKWSPVINITTATTH